MARPGAAPHVVPFVDDDDDVVVTAPKETTEKKPSAETKAEKEEGPLMVGDYALGSTLGKGSFGKVKLAKNVKTGEQVRFGAHCPVSKP